MMHRSHISLQSTLVVHEHFVWSPFYLSLCIIRILERESAAAALDLSERSPGEPQGISLASCGGATRWMGKQESGSFFLNCHQSCSDLAPLMCAWPNKVRGPVTEENTVWRSWYSHGILFVHDFLYGVRALYSVLFILTPGRHLFHHQLYFSQCS